MLKKTDRTKQLYCEALLDLCEERELAKLTIRELCERARTARQTFYNNFQDINDLISYLPINYLMTAQEDVLSTDNTRHAYEYALRHRGFFRQLHSHAGQNSFRDTFIPWLEEAFYAEYINEEMSENERLYRKLAIDIFAIGITNQFLDWCSSDFAWPLDILLRAQEEALPDFTRLPRPTGDASQAA